MNDNHDFLLEKRLREEAPDLHRRVTDSVVMLQRTLESFFTWFPDFTDHYTLHSMDVLDFCNQLLGDQVAALTIPECYALVMACYLHDIGMGVNRKDYEDFVAQLDLSEYRKKKPDADEARTIRDQHSEFSGLFIRKYAALFDIPSEALTFAIKQLSRGHRKTDLYDEKEFPDIETPDGVIRTAFLSAVLRLADEIDVGVDRNPEILFDTSKLTHHSFSEIFQCNTKYHVGYADTNRDENNLIYTHHKCRLGYFHSNLNLNTTINPTSTGNAFHHIIV